LLKATMKILFDDSVDRVFHSNKVRTLSTPVPNEGTSKPDKNTDNIDSIENQVANGNYVPPLYSSSKDNEKLETLLFSSSNSNGRSATEFRIAQRLDRSYIPPLPVIRSYELAKDLEPEESSEKRSN